MYLYIIIKLTINNNQINSYGGIMLFKIIQIVKYVLGTFALILIYAETESSFLAFIYTKIAAALLILFVFILSQYQKKRKTYEYIPIAGLPHRRRR